MSPTTPLEQTFQSLLASRQSRSLRRQLTLPPPDSIDFSSNDYLSLRTSAAIRTAYLAELNSPQPFPSVPGSDNSTTNTPPPLFPLGSGGSRLLDGNSAYALSLESSIAAFHRAHSGLLFTTGFDANVGLLSSAPQPGDVVVYDALVHASMHDGMRLSRAGARIPFGHNDAGALRSVLEGLVARDEKVRTGERNVFVAVESVYSMDGDVAPLAAMVEAVEAVLAGGNGYVVVDEAHATGVCGARGRGLVCALGLERRVFARVHTFGKAMGCAGAIVLASPLTRDYLINYARTLIYTTAPPFPLLANIRVVYDYLARGDADASIHHLHTLYHALHAQLTHLIASLPATNPPLLSLVSPLSLTPSNPIAPAPTPILPIYTPHPRSLASHCQRQGYMVRPVVPPTVPAGAARVRVCLHAGNTGAEVRGLVGCVRGWVGGVLKEGERAML
ncbi:uncharacterized protein K452DRAFT_349791 [Aplosporella prunicola CBS 121167]|uniref:Aminotransferase class I/classII large domain-containing protein n=1 Tax=Aplosporella prunicola CBS 121167 TaxID=1176127 RepID=A0A6A6BL23_9PEZI|nr:uncharacterized protein K452DRAFT_349791 [Aplosporella prunicola CBS 121167]KAF2144809.1 hypothetical protein K452DRAFT_349791 [Aplosporella prunicola CBS 121167]